MRLHGNTSQDEMIWRQNEMGGDVDRLSEDIVGADGEETDQG